MIEITFLFLLAFSFRFMVAKNTCVNSDTYGHLYFAKELKRQKVGPFGEIILKVVGAKGFRAPFFWHWLVSFFPIKKILQLQKWINPVIDALFAALIYLVALRMGLDRQTSFSIVLLYLLTPMWFSGVSIGPRINNFTPRLISELVTNLFFILTLLPLGIPVWLNLMLTALLSSLVLLSSKFGLQALLFLVPLISIIIWNPLPIAALTIGVVVTFTLTKGNFLKSTKEQLHHLSWYLRKNLKGEMAISSRNRLKSLFARPSSGGGLMQHTGLVLLRCISDNSYTSVLFKMPLLPVAFALYALSLIKGTGVIPLTILAPVIGATIIFIIINLPYLLFLGEAERYLNHVAFFISAMTVLLAVDAGKEWLLWILFGYGSIFWLIESLILPKLRSNMQKESVDEDIIKHLNSLKKTVVVLSYPYHAVGFWRIMLETEHHICTQIGTCDDFLANFENKYADDYPFVKLDKLDEMAREIGVNYFIATKASLTSRGLGNWTASHEWRKIEIGEPIYSVYLRIID